MRLATLIAPGGSTTTAAVVTDDTAMPLPFSDVGAMLASPNWATTVSGTRPAAIPLDTPGLAWSLPLRPAKTICVGLNYKTHIAETGRETPAWPTLFAKFPDTLTHPFAPITVPSASDQVDWEVELGVIVGKTIKDVDAATAQAAIVGYTVVNDVSMRDWQRRSTQWLQGKNFENTTPVGPVVVTADEVDPTRPLAIQCWVDDELVQDCVTSDLLFGAAELVSYVSRFTTLRPGDLIATGTPGGVGSARIPQMFLKPGQTLTSRIEGIGTLVNEIVAP